MEMSKRLSGERQEGRRRGCWGAVHTLTVVKPSTSLVDMASGHLEVLSYPVSAQPSRREVSSGSQVSHWWVLAPARNQHLP